MSIVEVPLSKKQKEAFSLLCSPSPIQLVYGGGARGGKSWLGSFWIIAMCKQYPGSQWLIARQELKALKRTTLRTLFKVLQSVGMKEGRDYKMNSQDMVMTIFNEGASDSAIFFAELREIPSDPEFDRLGSYDLTGIWLDECQEISKNAKDTLQARFTLLTGVGWKFFPKALYTCNPGKNWIYSEFWKPIIKEVKQNPIKKFITALFSDNPYIDADQYSKTVLATKNKTKIERLLHGNFDYDDTPGKLVNYDALCEIFGRVMDGGDKCLTVDPAGQGEDLAVAMLWEGFKIVKIWTWAKCKLTGEPTAELPSLEQDIREIMSEHLISVDRIAVDAVGLGQGLVDSLGCKAYVGNRSCIQPAEATRDTSKRLNYKDINAQCGKMLADMINEKKLSCCYTEHEEEIKEEIDFLIQIKVDQDKKFELMPKDDIKKMIGRSPNFRDAMMIRMLLELGKKETVETSMDDYMEAVRQYTSSGSHRAVGI